MSDAGVRERKQQLEAAMASERLAEALAITQELELREPAEARWPQRAGDLLRRLSRLREAADAYERAVERYARAGLLARAVAMAKTVTSLDPARTGVLSRLDQTGARGVTQRVRSARTRPSLAPAPLRKPSLAPPAPERPLSVPAPPRPDDDEDDDEDCPTYEALPRVDVPLELDELDLLYVAEEAAQPSAEAGAERLAVLPLFALFSEVPEEALRELAAASQLLELPAGEAVIRTGEAADALFAIVVGCARVRIPGDGEEVVLSEGEVFGESCLLTNEPRHADVLAEGTLTALRIPKATLDALVARHREVGRLLTQLLAHRLVANLVRSSPLFSALDVDMRREAVQLFELRKAAHGTLLLEAGKRGDGLYVALTGELHVARADGQTIALAPGTVVGTTALLSQAPFPHTVHTLGDVLLLRLSSSRFLELVTQFPSVLERLSELSLEDELAMRAS